MSTREYQIPIMIDVTAESVQAASEGAVEILANADIVGEAYGDTRVESWWTLEEVAKPFDHNDNEHGVVVFQYDLDYLHRLLERTWHEGEDCVAQEDIARHTRLMHYFTPGYRCGADDFNSED